jgi:hypothetical protein
LQKTLTAAFGTPDGASANTPTLKVGRDGRVWLSLRAGGDSGGEADDEMAERTVAILKGEGVRLMSMAQPDDPDVAGQLALGADLVCERFKR